MCWTSPSYARSFYGCSTRVGDRTGLLPCRGRIDVYVGSLQETKNEARKRQNDRRKSTDAVEKVAARCCHSTGRKIDLSDRPISRSEAYVEGKATLENLANSSTPTFSTTSTLKRHSALCSSIVRFSHICRRPHFRRLLAAPDSRETHEEIRGAATEFEDRYNRC